jgi:hypothetical protein
MTCPYFRIKATKDVCEVTGGRCNSQGRDYEQCLAYQAAEKAKKKEGT